MNMSERISKTIPDFCRKHRFSRSHYYNLRSIGRGPTETRIGGVVTISPESEDAWEKEIADNPIVGGLRVAAERARTAEAA
jgi:hypothetical protein